MIGGGGVPMYTEICAELGATIAVASSAPYIQFSLMLYLLELGRFGFFQHGKDYYSVSIGRAKVTGGIDLNRCPGQTDLLKLRFCGTAAFYPVDCLFSRPPQESSFAQVSL